MERMSHAEQHRKFPPGTVVVSADGRRLGTVRTVYDHYFLVSQDGTQHADLEVPPHAVARFDGERIYLTVNREALSVVDDEEAASRRLHTDGV
jgi:hypothetical protein